VGGDRCNYHPCGGLLSIVAPRDGRAGFRGHNEERVARRGQRKVWHCAGEPLQGAEDAAKWGIGKVGGEKEK
jgi:hypothetical protein